MFNKIYVVSLLFLIFTGNALADTLSQPISYGTETYNDSNDSVQTLDGGYLVVGSTLDPSVGDGLLGTITKFDNELNIVESVSIPDTLSPFYSSSFEIIEQKTNGAYLILSVHEGAIGKELYLIEVNDNLDIINTKQVLADYPKSNVLNIEVIGDDIYIMGEATDPSLCDCYYPFLYKLNNNLDIAATYDGPFVGGSDTYFADMIVNRDGNIILFGGADVVTTFANSSVYLTELDKDLILIKESEKYYVNSDPDAFSGFFYSYAPHVHQLDSGEYLSLVDPKSIVMSDRFLKFSEDLSSFVVISSVYHHHVIDMEVVNDNDYIIYGKDDSSGDAIAVNVDAYYNPLGAPAALSGSEDNGITSIQSYLNDFVTFGESNSTDGDFINNKGDADPFYSIYTRE